MTQHDTQLFLDFFLVTTGFIIGWIAYELIKNFIKDWYLRKNGRRVDYYGKEGVETACNMDKGIEWNVYTRWKKDKLVTTVTTKHKQQ